MRAGQCSLSLEPFLQVLEGSVSPESLDVHAIALDLTSSLLPSEVGVNDGGETVFTGDEDLLTAGELELGTTKSLLGVGDVVHLGANGDEDIANVDTGSFAESLTVSVTHTGLESISTGARKHLVDANNVPCVDSNANMERILGGLDGHVLVSGNTGGFESLGRNLLLFSANQMDASGEKVPLSLLFTTVVHSEFWVRYTTVEAGLGVRLVFLVSVATCGSSSHFILII